MEKSRFFNSVSGDRKYLAEDFAGYFSNILSNGVFLHQATALKVTPSSGLTVAVAAGKAYINGYCYENTTTLTKTFETVVANRIDRIAVRLDMVNRKMETVIKKGAAASTPSAPALVRNSDTWELGIADVYLAAGTTIVTAAMITDLRANSTYCGGVTMTVDRDEILGDITTTFAEFTQAGSRANINTNETMAVVLGKIKKYFADLKTLAFLSSVGSGQIDDLAVSTAELAAGAVTAAKLAASAVTTEKLNAASVTAAKLAASAVTLEKIADGVITNAKIASSAAIAQSKIAGLVEALASKLESSGTYPNLTAGNATKATGDQYGTNISTYYAKKTELVKKVVGSGSIKVGLNNGRITVGAAPTGKTTADILSVAFYQGGFHFATTQGGSQNGNTEFDCVGARSFEGVGAGLTTVHARVDVGVDSSGNVYFSCDDLAKVNCGNGGNTYTNYADQTLSFTNITVFFK